MQLIEAICQLNVHQNCVSMPTPLDELVLPMFIWQYWIPKFSNLTDGSHLELWKRHKEDSWSSSILNSRHSLLLFSKFQLYATLNATMAPAQWTRKGILNVFANKDGQERTVVKVNMLIFVIYQKHASKKWISVLLAAHHVLSSKV